VTLGLRFKDREGTGKEKGGKKREKKREGTEERESGSPTYCTVVSAKKLH